MGLNKEETGSVTLQEIEEGNRSDQNVDNLRLFLKTSSPPSTDWKKTLSLVVQTFQTVVVVFITSASRKDRDSNGILYLATTAVAMSELLKLTVCIFLSFWETYSTSGSFQENLSSFYSLLRTELLSSTTIKCSIPAILYSFQANLNYIGFSNLDMIVYQIVYQTKILITAIFSVIILKKSINRMQWFSLVILMMGVCCVTLSTKQSTSEDEEESDETWMFSRKTLIGLCAVLISSFLSGFCGVYTEKILKESKTSIWVRNIQLSIFNLSCSVLIALSQDYDKIQARGWFQGYTALTYWAIFGQAVAGLVVATVLKYADNVSKGFATSIAIVISTILGVVFMHTALSELLIFGSVSVSIAVFLYTSGGDLTSIKFDCF